MQYRLTSKAKQDMREIRDYIALDNRLAANDWIKQMVQHFRLLGAMPRMGRIRSDLGLDYRSFPVGNYLIFYTIEEPMIRILHIIHNRRDIEHFTF
jgi:toxin ParE1/3/4